MIDLPVTVETERLNEQHGFAVKVGGRPVYSSRTSFRCDGVTEFLTNNPALAKAIAGFK